MLKLEQTAFALRSCHWERNETTEDVVCDICALIELA